MYDGSSHLGISGFRFMKLDSLYMAFINLSSADCNDGARIRIENESPFMKLDPKEDLRDFKIVKLSDNEVEWNVNSSEKGQTMQIVMTYKKARPWKLGIYLSEHWPLNKTKTWLFICATLGGIVSFAKVIEYVRKKK
jgi:hypothetical protein